MPTQFIEHALDHLKGTGGDYRNMHRTIVLQVALLIILLMLPISRAYKVFLILLLGIFSYKTMLITWKLLELCFWIARRRGRSVYKKIVNRIFREHFEFRHNFSAIPSIPTIFIATYPNRAIEYLAPALLPTPMYFIASARAKPVMSSVYPDEECGYLPQGKKQLYQMTKELIGEKIKTMSVFMYVEDMSRRYGRDVGGLRKGVFWIAKELGVTITPVVIDNIRESWDRVPNQRYEVYIGPTMYVHDPLSTLVDVRTMMRKKKASLKKSKFFT
jgi:hypothetical protein